MAKSKSFWGLRRGSAGTLTFAKSSKGEQITKAKITSMKNPKTAAQNVQRMTFAGLAHARARWNDIVNHSFEGETPKISSLSMFTKRNLKFAETLRYLSDPNDWDFNQGSADGSIPIGYKGGGGLPCKVVLADGSLPVRPWDVDNEYANLIDLQLSFPSAGGTIPTFGEMFAQSGIAVGDWLTFCIECWDSGAGTISEEYVHSCWVRFKVIADGVNVSATIANMATVFQVEMGGDDMGISYGMMTSGDLRGVGIHCAALADDNVLSLVTLIHSRDTDNQRKRSAAILDFVCTGSFPAVATISAFEQALGEAAATWQIGNAYVLDGGYETYQAMSVPNWYEYQAEHGHQGPRPVPQQPAEP